MVLRQTPDSRRALFDVLEVLDEIEADYAARIGRRSFDELKRLLAELLEQNRPGGRT